MSEKIVKIAHDLYRARNICKSLYEDVYQKNCAEYGKYIKAAMAKHSCDELQAVIHILTLLKEKGDSHPMAGVWVMAAAVEMLEPSC